MQVVNGRIAVSGLVVACAVLVALSGPVSVAADSPLHVGHAVRVVNAVDCEIPDQPRRPLAQTEKVFFDEDVFTGAKAKAVVQFRDGSTLEVGPDAMVTLDDMVFNPEEGRSGKVMSVLRGTFRYVSAYAGSDAGVTIRTPTGTLGIRGSVVSGVVHSGIPVFVHVASGQAVFENDGGQVGLEAGNAIAVPERQTAPMNPEWMPVGVAAETIGYIESVLGPVDGLPPATAISAELRQSDARANAVAVSTQQAAGGGGLQPLDGAAGGGPPPPLPLLAEGSGIGLFAGSAGASPDAGQRAFVERAAQAYPDAQSFLTGVNEAQRKYEGTRKDQGAVVVVTGLTEIAESPRDVARIVQSAAAAYPSGAAVISEAAMKAGALNPVTGGDAAALAENVAVSASLGAPEAADAVAARVAGLVPEAAVQVAQAVSQVVPNRAREIAYGVAGAVPEAAPALGVTNWTGSAPANRPGGGWQPIK